VHVFTVMYRVIEPPSLVTFNCDGENVQKSVVPGAKSIPITALSLSGFDSFDCRTTRWDFCIPRDNESMIPPESRFDNSPYIGLSGKEEVARQQLDAIVAKNSHRRIIDR